MQLIYAATGKPVQVGDIVTLSDGGQAVVEFFREPHKPSSSGHVSVSVTGGRGAGSAEYYVGVIGARWIDREDQR
jgi:hypothetical protein